MCCKTSISQWDPAIAEAILRIGQFELVSGLWVRLIGEEGARVSAYHDNDSLSLSLSPAVSSYEGHEHKRIAASVMYEIAARYAEKVNGVIQQEGINVRECQDEGRTRRTIAVYPESRLDFSLLCPGFRGVFLAGVESP